MIQTHPRTARRGPKDATDERSYQRLLKLPAATVADVMTQVMREGAQRILIQAMEIEVKQWIEARAHLVDEQGRRQVVRNGHLPAREILTGLGPIEITQPRVHDRRPPGRAPALHLRHSAAVLKV